MNTAHLSIYVELPLFSSVVFSFQHTNFAHILYEPHCPHRARALCVHRRKEDPAPPGEEEAGHGHPRHLCLDSSCQATVAGPGERAGREAVRPGRGGHWKQGGLAGEARVRRGSPRQGGRTHHRAHVSCLSLLPRGAWQALRRCTRHGPR